jgi:hypothetical protein
MVKLGLTYSGDGQDKLRWIFNSDPVGRMLTTALTPLAEAVSGSPLVPSYSYFCGYRPGSALPRHRNRDACRVTIGLTFASSGDPWPLEIEGKLETVQGLAQAGDLAIFAGTRQQSLAQTQRRIMGLDADVSLHRQAR